jgi:two-component system chemotaxis response regulator CheB
MPDATSRVLIVDDSAITRRLIAAALRDDPAIEVVAEARDAFSANALIAQHRPDLVTLDLEMPRMDGLALLRHLSAHHPVPVIIVSAHTREGSAATLEALRAGAAEVILKPQNPSAIAPFARHLRRCIHDLRHCAFRPRPAPASQAPAGRIVRSLGSTVDAIIAIGASTGGPPAIETVLSNLPADAPPVVIVQHMPASFTGLFARRLDEVSPMRVAEAEHGQRLARGTALVAPGDHHLAVERREGELVARLQRGPAVHHQRPAVDVLFDSLARLSGPSIVAVLLTGMGEDGAAGMVKLAQAGHETIAEDEQSCVVFGMPHEAIARGGAKHVVALGHVPAAIVECLGRLEARARLRHSSGEARAASERSSR